MDIKQLGVDLKAVGLDVAEDGLSKLVGVTLEWLHKGLKEHSNPLVKVLAETIPPIKDEALKLIDKLDGKDDLK